jgi:hypothetical protein
MSVIISRTGAATFDLVTRRNDESLMRPEFRARRRTDPFEITWRRSGFLGRADMAIFDAPANQFEYSDYRSGKSTPKMITGTAYDANGNVLAGATIMLFNTATGLLVETVTADAAGYFRIGDPNGVACFIVAYLAGAPDVFGTTTNTLTGS